MSPKTPSQLVIKTDQQRKADFLTPLAVGWFIFHIPAFVIMVIPPTSTMIWFVIITLSFFINLLVILLTRRGYIEWAAHLFCYYINSLLFAAFLINLIIDRVPTSATLFSVMLALGVLLAGALISPRATFGFTVLNGILMVSALNIANMPDFPATRSIPIISFFFLISIISWLYQTTLDRAQAQLRRTQILQRDIQIARELQQQLFPQSLNLGPNYTVVARSMPARETGGDFYDLIRLSEHQFGIVVADVSGKSIPAAMIMTMARSTLRSEAQQLASPARVLERTNQVLLDDSAVNQMITAFYGLLNTEAMTFHFSNAGHIAPVLKRNGLIEEFELPGLPLGVLHNPGYQEHLLRFQPGDQLILSSDGLAETLNLQGELFGFDRMADIIRQTNNQNPQQLLEEIWKIVETFRGDTEQQDDMTVVIIGVEANQLLTTAG